MWFLLACVVVWLLLSYGGKIAGLFTKKQPERRSGNPTETAQERAASSPSGASSKSNPDVYRPRKTARSASIKFAPVGVATENLDADTLDGLHDAFTGASLNPALGLHQCTNCKVYYHSESVTVLREVNEMRCVACGTASIVVLKVGQASSSTGRDYSPTVVTLGNFRSNFNQVITFEGTVISVKTSRRGSDYAVMFENKSWTRGLKLVFFRGAITKVGGAGFVNGLDGRRVRVRGLLLNDAKFGPEIIVSERGMILDIK